MPQDLRERYSNNYGIYKHVIDMCKLNHHQYREISITKYWEIIHVVLKKTYVNLLIAENGQFWPDINYYLVHFIDGLLTTFFICSVVKATDSIEGREWTHCRTTKVRLHYGVAPHEGGTGQVDSWGGGGDRVNYVRTKYNV